ncbi:peptidase U32 family protein [Vallitalea guaymasensis]|uniref:peptidase U32 family protein n=1 Tax=Vallitalea guaymasensis TaxID=1185412 RepID=UPI00272D0B44|nr:U32 family peptidase [Vallitalea guaymasensis]
MNKPELLIPAGSLENLEVAVLYGADAVYIGGQHFGLRAKAKNFSTEQMKEGIDFAHKHNVKVYVTANIIAHNDDIDKVYEYFEEIKEIKPDALIIADPGILTIAQEMLPDMEIHLSTQANNTNYKSVNFWHKLGVKRVVVARELSFKEINQIKENSPDTLDIEAFVHGAMCISYSGRCLLSNYMAGRDANKGECTHPCRWQYHLVEETRPDEYMPVYENERGTYVYNSKDLCMLEYVPELIDAGVGSFKIEGRMKTQLYVATVTRTYRKAIDDYFEDESKYRNNIPYYLDEIKKCTHRKFTTGFYFKRPDENEQIYNSNTYIRSYTFIGKVIEYNSDEKMVTIQQRNKFCVGDEVEFMATDGENYVTTIKEMWDEEGNLVESAPHPKQVIRFKIDKEFPKNTIIRLKSKEF